MTFFKNLKAELTALIVALLAAWVAQVPVMWMVYGLTLFIPATIFVLYLEDFYRKADEDRSLLTYQYFLGGVVLIGAMVAWFWASQSTTVAQQGVRLGVTFLVSVVGTVWFNKAYKHSIQTDEEQEIERIEKFEKRYQKRWTKICKKIAKAGKEEALRYIGANLAYRLVGDSLDGDVNFDLPLAVINDEPLTYNQLVAMKDDAAGTVVTKRNTAYQYIQNLVAGKE